MTRWLRRLTPYLLSVVAVVHAALVWPHYAVGSFDDDSSYLLAARALGHGHGLTSPLPVGLPLAATYPPGYPALLAPLARLAGPSFVPEQVLSLVLLAALLPLTWLLLRRTGLGETASAAVLALMALNPVLATYGVMVMAELPFLVLLVGVLLAAQSWERQGWSHTGGRVAAAVTVIGAGGLVLLKEAGLGAAAGIGLWLLLRPHIAGRRVRLAWHRPVRALVYGAGVGVLLLPVVIARLGTHTPLLGARYSSEIGGGLSGGFAHRLTAGLPSTLHTYFSEALPNSVVPVRWAGSPLPGGPVVGAGLDLLALLVPVLIVVGAVVWQRRYGGPVVPAVVVYSLEALAFPYTNERRVILVLPAVLAFLVVGVDATLRRLRAHALQIGIAGVVSLATVVVLVCQLDRDYLFPAGGDSSQLRGSPYLSMIAAAAQPGDLVETDFVWTVALETGLHTSGTVSSLNPKLSPVQTPDCAPADVRAAVLADRPGWVLSGAFVQAGIGDPCLLGVVSGAPYAVRLLRTQADQSAVFELIGPGTAHPGLSELTTGTPMTAGVVAPTRPEPSQAGEPPGTFPVVTATAAPTDVTQLWGAARPVSQVSVGAVTPEPADPNYPEQPGPGAVSQVRLQLLEGSTWVDVASHPGVVGIGGSADYLLAKPAAGTMARGVRVMVSGSGTVGVHDLRVLGG